MRDGGVEAKGRSSAPAGRGPRALLCAKSPEGQRRLTVSYQGPSVQLEMVCGNEALWSGQWRGEVRLDGVPAGPVSAWELTCRVSDVDVDYLELQISLTGGLRVQRHVLLTRKDGFVLLADAVLGERSGTLEYCGSLPLAPGVTFRGAKATREGILRSQSAGRLARVLPLTLPEWRRDARAGDLVFGSQELELRQTVEGKRLFAPLFFDLDRRRGNRRFTWRQLTVAESMRICPADVAVGYRVAIGKEQWLLYRSLAEKANRTVLGHNLATEMLVARFRRDGEVESLVEIE